MRKYLYIYLFSLAFSANAQAPEKLLSFGVSPVSYRGDLNEKFDIWGGGVSASFILLKAKRVNGEFNFTYGQIWGNNPNFDTQDKTNNYFKSNFFTLGYNVRLNLLSKEKYRLYFSPGVSIFRFNPKDQAGNDLQDDIATRANDEDYSNISFALPIKFGGMYLLDNKIGISYEFGWFNPLTDYLDNISELGTREKNDNVMFHKISVLIPLKSKSSTD